MTTDLATIQPLIGHTISLSDGTPQPPARFTKKLREWKRQNYTGRIVEMDVQPPTYPNGSPLPHAGWWHTTIAKGTGMFQGVVTVEFRAIVFLSPDLSKTADGRTVTIA